MRRWSRNQRGCGRPPEGDGVARVGRPGAHGGTDCRGHVLVGRRGGEGMGERIGGRFVEVREVGV